MSHLMRWILLKQTKISDTESEQRKNILKSRKVGMRKGGSSGRREVQDSCLMLASLCHEKRDCIAIIFFIFLKEVILALASTESFTFSPKFYLFSL